MRVYAPLLSVASALSLASAARVGLEEDLALDQEPLQSSNQSLAEYAAENRQESGIIVHAAWGAFNLAFQIYEDYTETKEAVESYKRRKEAVDKIVEGHTQGVEFVVEAANSGLASCKGGSKELGDIINGDTFRHFKDLLTTFEKAQQMCVTEASLKDPAAYFMRLVGKRPKTAEEEHLAKAKTLIGDVVKSLQAVMDEGVCPQLKRVVKKDLLEAQTRVEEWEAAVKETTRGQPTSYYQTLYEKYDPDHVSSPLYNWIAGTKVMNEATKIFRRVTYPDKKKCFATAGGAGGKDGISAKEAYRWHALGMVFDKDEKLRVGSHLSNVSLEVSTALDRASMNMDMFDKECRRKAPGGKERIIKELQKEAKEGDEDAAKMLKPWTCDFCMRDGCRELGMTSVLDVLYRVYKINDFGIEDAVEMTAKAGHLPKWVGEIAETVKAGKDLVQGGPLEFYKGVIFLVAKGADNFEVGETCVEMGRMLEQHRTVKETLDELVEG